MDKFDVAGKVLPSGEYILGAEQTGSHACYLVYGVLKAGEQGRELKPGKGHEEIVLVVQGDVVLTGQFTGMLAQGQAIHLKGEEACYAENRGEGEAVYVIAGGHGATGHHH